SLSSLSAKGSRRGEREKREKERRRRTTATTAAPSRKEDQARASVSAPNPRARDRTRIHGAGGRPIRGWSAEALCSLPYSSSSSSPCSSLCSLRPSVIMPKDRRSRSLSFERQFHAPYPCHSTACQKHSSSSSSSRPSTEVATSEADIKEWEEARCSVCMEHPHNAVLLLCSSHDKGCRPYMCDTSYRHSNCLDQFRKAFAGDASCPENSGIQDQAVKLSCPLCRGEVTNWTVVEPARRYMNAKARICSLESCGYSGKYGELRKHARTEHPSVRPSDADPERQRNWRRMERQRDIEDLLSTIRPLFADDGMAVVGNDADEANVLDSRQQFFYCVMIIRLHQRQEDVGAAPNSSHPQVFVTFGSRRQPTRRHRRRRSHTEVGEEQEEETTLTLEGDHSDGNNDGDGEDLPLLPLLGGSSASPQHATATRRRRRMRMSDEEDLL
ncbi:hypothetical protein Taro_023986, partial [Colocasia esculenta]|nr:hypothetical protein [Colocasia esculenta]